jgi:hypothetical protein
MASGFSSVSSPSFSDAFPLAPFFRAALPSIVALPLPALCLSFVPLRGGGQGRVALALYPWVSAG